MGNTSSVKNQQISTECFKASELVCPLAKRCTSCGKEAEFYKKGPRLDSICKNCRKELRNERYKRSVPNSKKHNLENITTDVKLIENNDNWSSIIFQILKNNFIKENSAMEETDN